jgi:hypothetical protein
MSTLITCLGFYINARAQYCQHKLYNKPIHQDHLDFLNKNHEEERQKYGTTSVCLGLQDSENGKRNKGDSGRDKDIGIMFKP